MQQPSSVPPDTLQRIQSSIPNANTPSDHSSAGSGWVTTTSTSSWASTRGDSHSHPSGRGDVSMPWSGYMHQVKEGDKSLNSNTESGSISSCNQAVIITCLHLSHEMGLREVGMYAWTLPVVKDPMGSMLKIMKQYTQQIKKLSEQSEINVRSVPDPSKNIIQHHLQRARLAAGPNSYVAVFYSGHGIQEPPTGAGELWCYDKTFDECVQNGGGPSEYIPIMLFDLLTWAGATTCYVWDCQYSGRFIRAALAEAEEIDSQLRAAAVQNPSVAELHPAIYSSRQIHFAACGANQTLPRIEGMPDDLFTACLTTPLRIALLFHNLQSFPLTKSDAAKSSQRSTSYMTSLWENMSQSLKDRLWMELKAILHTIAWQTLDGKEYQKLFGKNTSMSQGDDVVSNLSSGFLLSQRVLGAYHLSPESVPSIPSCTSHALWNTWDLILDNLFEQLPKYFDEPLHPPHVNGNARSSIEPKGQGQTLIHTHINTPTMNEWEKSLKLVSFMADQLESITTGQTIFSEISQRKGILPSLNRLPIICAAATITPTATATATPSSLSTTSTASQEGGETLRIQACQALDTCISILDLKGLAHSVQGGSLDTAIKLLKEQQHQSQSQSQSVKENGNGNGKEIKSHLISIWSSLVRYQPCVKALTLNTDNSNNTGGSSGDLEGITISSNILFFLESLEEQLGLDLRQLETHASENPVETQCSPNGNVTYDTRGKDIKPPSPSAPSKNDLDFTLTGISDREDVDVIMSIQTAVVLGTLAKYLTAQAGKLMKSKSKDKHKYKTMGFVKRSLGAGREMIRHSNDLMRVWGAILIAEMISMASAYLPTSDLEELLQMDQLREQLLGMIEKSAECRATAIYALARWIRPPPYPSSSSSSLTDRNEQEKEEEQKLVLRLLDQAKIEGSSVVRKELINVFLKYLHSTSEHKSNLCVWLTILEPALRGIPEYKDEIERAVTSSKIRVVEERDMRDLQVIKKVLSVLGIMRMDPDANVAKGVDHYLKDKVRSTLNCSDVNVEQISWEQVYRVTFRNDITGAEEKDKMVWTENILESVLKVRIDGIKDSNKKDESKLKGTKGTEDDFFDKTRLSLQAYLAVAAGRYNVSTTSTVAGVEGEPDNKVISDVEPKQVSRGLCVGAGGCGCGVGSTWTERYRRLEDSIVVGEQQVGLPWKWEMKDIISPDPWTTTTFHSFHSTVMSCNRTRDLSLWDWTSSRKQGTIHLDISPNCHITSARFVNELHDRIVILAEINNGDIHVLAGPQDPELIHPIACFKALSIPPAFNYTSEGEGINDNGPLRQLSTTWFRQSGLLCVGGPSPIINVWDCPSEKQVRNLVLDSNIDTNTDTYKSSSIFVRTSTTSLITEPVSGNLIFAGTSDGFVRLYDLRQSRKSSLLYWKGDASDAVTRSESTSTGGKSENRYIVKIGVGLGESKYVTSACANGTLNIHDLRNLSQPTSSVLVHPGKGKGTSSASFQAHSGLMSTISTLSPSSSLSFSLYRSTLGTLIPVTQDQLQFNSNVNVNGNGRPYTVFHPLRPFLGIGYGNKCILRGAGVGKGDDTDSGSYSFLRAQAGLMRSN